MNNKLIARVVAGAMAVAMLGTVSFATKIDADKTTVTPGTITTPSGNYDEQAEKTFMAFATDDNSTAFDANSDVIIALGQQGELPDEISVDSTKLGKKYVVAVYSGTQGYKATKIIDVSSKTRSFDISTTLEKEFPSLDGTTKWTNVAYTACEFSPQRGDSTLTKVGLRFTKGEKFVDVTTENGTEFTGTGTIMYAAVLYNVPEADFNGMTATPIAEYADFVD